MSSLSLQTHLVSSQPQLPAVSVDPRGFKTALQSLTNFLIAHKIPATLWLKLPKDDAWWTDIWQYGQQAVGCTIYTLGDQIGTPPENLAASLRSIPIEQGAQLKREYLCLAVADSFTSVLLAARTPPGTPIPDKRTLKLYSTLSSSSAAALSIDIKSIIEHSLPAAQDTLPKAAEAAAAQVAEATESPAMTADQPSAFIATELLAANPEDIENSKTEESRGYRDQSIAAAAVLSQWERCFPAALAQRNCQFYADAYLSWQIQFQEDLRSQLTTYRNTDKAEIGSVLSTLSPDFLNQAGQELQSPLTTIKTALTLLGSPTLKLAQRQRYLEMISTQCDRQKSLINSVIDLLQIHTTEAISPQPLQLANIIPGIVSTYQPIAEERGIMLAYTIPPTLSEILGTEAALKQVVIHLLNNGIEITPKGGRVWVSAAPHDANFIALTVQDSGAGMSKPDSAKLFEAFYRNPASGEAGTGLGLTLVQQLVQRMGGSVSVDSVLSRGTTFKILLPVHRTNPVNGTAAQTSESQPTASQPTASQATASQSTHSASLPNSSLAMSRS